MRGARADRDAGGHGGEQRERDRDEACAAAHSGARWEPSSSVMDGDSTSNRNVRNRFDGY
jgi:hypothetical protein